MIEEKNKWDKNGEQAPWNLMVLSMGFYDMFVSLKAKYFNIDLRKVAKCEYGFIVTEFSGLNCNNKEKIVSIISEVFSPVDELLQIKVTKDDLFKRYRKALVAELISGQRRIE